MNSKRRLWPPARRPGKMPALQERPGMRLKRVFTILVLVILLGALLITMMPRGYDSDLARIGQGQPAAVLVHDPQFLASADLMQSIDGLRRDFEPEVLFLVADLNVPEGRRFAEEHSADFGTLVLFDADGRRLATHAGHTGEAVLREFLATHYR